MSVISSRGLAENLQQLQQAFTRADTNKSKGLSQSEFTSALQNIPGLAGQSGTDAANLFQQLDTSGDVQLSTTEIADGIKLAQKVSDALLKAQELTSGSTLLNLIGGKSAMAQAKAGEGNTSIADMFMTEGTSTDNSQLNQLIQQVMAKYQATENAATAPQSATTPVTA